MSGNDAPESSKDRIFIACLSFLCLLLVIFADILISQLSQAVKAYEIDHDGYPAGDGSGSVELRKCLQSPGPKKFPYFEFEPTMIDARGNMLSPVGEGKVISYRCPGIHNPNSFDLWCEDMKGRADGINNWTR